MFCPLDGTAVLKGLINRAVISAVAPFFCSTPTVSYVRCRKKGVPGAPVGLSERKKKYTSYCQVVFGHVFYAYLVPSIYLVRKIGDT